MSTTTLADIPRLRQQCEVTRQYHREIKRAVPLVRLWTNKPDSSAGLVLRGKAGDSVSGRFPFKKNAAQQGVLRLRLDHYLARWLVSIPNNAAAKKNIVITVDHMGGVVRWSGLLKNWKITRDANGIRYLDAVFVDDLQYLQFMLGPPNPLLPIPIFQFPRVLPLFGPAKWAISMMILINLIRLEGNLWTLPDDPLAADSWNDLFDWSDWQVLIKARPFDLDDSSLWTILATRMNRMDTVIADALDDAQLVMTYRRILTVDGETCPVDGVPVCRNGALVLEVVDKSGYWNADGTGTGGGIIGGFVRTAQSFLAGFIEDTQNLVVDSQAIQPGEYYQTGYLGTVPSHPWVVVRDSDWTSMQTSQLTWAPATAIGVIVGGDNPLADQLARLTIETIGALIGYFVRPPALAGGGADKVPPSCWADSPDWVPSRPISSCRSWSERSSRGSSGKTIPAHTISDGHTSGRCISRVRRTTHGHFLRSRHCAQGSSPRNPRPRTSSRSDSADRSCRACISE